MKILCAWCDQEEEEPRLLEQAPSEVLSEHEVVEVHTYEHLRNMFLLSTADDPMFDVVLADLSLPPPEMDEDDLQNLDATFMLPGVVPGVSGDIWCPTILLQHNFNNSFIRGFGIFVPTYFESVFVFSDPFHTVVASKDFWLPNGNRDWEGLLHCVVSKFS